MMDDKTKAALERIKAVREVYPDDAFACDPVDIQTMLSWVEDEPSRHPDDSISSPCAECGELTQPYAGDPGIWPTLLPSDKELGKMVHYHIKCVLEWRAYANWLRGDTK